MREIFTAISGLKKFLSMNVFAIGALGGSGTRAVAKILQGAGVYMGDDLNEPLDNLVFTRLFKNPDWYQSSRPDEKNYRLKIFQSYMQNGRLPPVMLFSYLKASFNNPLITTSVKNYIHSLSWMVRPTAHRLSWGWKEPNTQIYVEDILSFYPSLKYIHVLRHGLDMAFSSNKQQLYNWGWLYNIQCSKMDDEITQSIQQLNYWIATTRHILNLTQKYPDRITLLSHSKLCTNPIETIDHLFEFLNIKVRPEILTKLYRIPKNNGTINRYKERDISIFSSSQIQFVKDMGFQVE